MITLKDFIRLYISDYDILVRRKFFPAKDLESIPTFIARYCNFKNNIGIPSGGDGERLNAIYKNYVQKEEATKTMPHYMYSLPEEYYTAYGLDRTGRITKPIVEGKLQESPTTSFNYDDFREALDEDSVSEEVSISKRHIGKKHGLSYKTISNSIYNTILDTKPTVKERDDETTEKDIFSKIIRTAVSPERLYFNINPITFETEMCLLLDTNFKTKAGKYIKIVRNNEGFELKLIDKKEYTAICNRGSYLNYNNFSHLFFDYYNPKCKPHQDDFSEVRFPETNDQIIPIEINLQLTEDNDRTTAKLLIENQEYNIYMNNIYLSCFILKENIIDLVLNYKYPKDKVVRTGSEILYKDQKFKVIETYDHSPNLYLVEDENKKQQVIKRSKKTPIVKL